MCFYRQILVFLFHGATYCIGLQQNNQQSSLNLFKTEGFSSVSYERCQRLCVYASACASFDWNKETRVCQLNRDSSERNENTKTVSVNQIGANAGPCMKRPCSSGHMCVPVASSTDFKCLFMGETAPEETITTPSTHYIGCNYTTNSAAGEYTLTTEDNGHYSINMNCIIELLAPSLPHDTVLDFTHFDVEVDASFGYMWMNDKDGCHYDYLNILVRSRVVDTLCGTLEPFIKTYKNPGDLQLTFTSDYIYQFSGFSFKYSHHIKYCNATINGTSGSFATRPGGYQNNEVCFFTIFTQTSVELDFTFSKFDIEKSFGCKHDSLTMGDDKLCGTSIQNKTYPSNGTFVMKLTTNGSVRKDGFHLSFTSRTTPN